MDIFDEAAAKALVSGGGAEALRSERPRVKRRWQEVRETRIGSLLF